MKISGKCVETRAKIRMNFPIELKRKENEVDITLTPDPNYATASMYIFTFVLLINNNIINTIYEQQTPYMLN